MSTIPSGRWEYRYFIQPAWHTRNYAAHLFHTRPQPKFTGRLQRIMVLLESPHAPALPRSLSADCVAGSGFPTVDCAASPWTLPALALSASALPLVHPATAPVAAREAARVRRQQVLWHPHTTPTVVPRGCSLAVLESPPAPFASTYRMATLTRWAEQFSTRTTVLSTTHSSACGLSSARARSSPAPQMGASPRTTQRGKMVTQRLPSPEIRVDKARWHSERWRASALAFALFEGD